VTPPSDFSKYIWSLINSLKSSSMLAVLPRSSIAFAGQASAQSPQPVQSSRFITIPCSVLVRHSWVQVLIHVPQPMHRFSSHCIWGFIDMLSGLWHHRQRSGHPLKNTVVRMPGPSSVENLCKCSIIPLRFFFVSSRVLALVITWSSGTAFAHMFK